MLSAAVRLPLAEGVNITTIGQWPPGATELPQVLAWAKLLALVPVNAMLVRLKAALPVLLRVTALTALVMSTGSLPKARVVGERLTTGAMPVPERLTVWGLPVALSEMLNVPLLLPRDGGVKLTLI